MCTGSIILIGVSRFILVNKNNEVFLFALQVHRIMELDSDATTDTANMN